jgi:hypothetical protein
VDLKKIELAFSGKSGAWGKMIHKKPEAKFLITLSL